MNNPTPTSSQQSQTQTVQFDDVIHVDQTNGSHKNTVNVRQEDCCKNVKTNIKRAKIITNFGMETLGVDMSLKRAHQRLTAIKEYLFKLQKLTANRDVNYINFKTQLWFSMGRNIELIRDLCEFLEVLHQQELWKSAKKQLKLEKKQLKNILSKN